MTKKVYFLILLLSPAVSSWSHNYDGHNKELMKILFGNDYVSISDKGKRNFDLLCKAAYITLDYTSDNDNRNSGQRFIADLKQNGIENIPSLELISFPANQYHQMYTHFGWDKGYRGVVDKGNWKVRKQLLLSTVDHICKMEKEEKIKMDAFAALVYECHILGDHIGDNEQTRNTRIRLVSEPGYKGQIVSPTSDGPFNNPTLYTYLLYHIQRLFREQKNTYEYIQIISFLNRHRDEFSKDSDLPPYEDIKYLAIKTKKELIHYIPKLLAREDFFQRAFLR